MNAAANFSSDRFRDARVAGGFSQPQLAEAAGLHVQTIRGIEQGRTPNPGVETLAAIARVLGCAVDAFLNGQAA